MNYNIVWDGDGNIVAAATGNTPATDNSIILNKYTHREDTLILYVRKNINWDNYNAYIHICYGTDNLWFNYIINTRTTEYGKAIFKIPQIITQVGGNYNINIVIKDKTSSSGITTGEDRWVSKPWSFAVVEDNCFIQSTYTASWTPLIGSDIDLQKSYRQITIDENNKLTINNSNIGTQFDKNTNIISFSVPITSTWNKMLMAFFKGGYYISGVICRVLNTSATATVYYAIVPEEVLVLSGAVDIKIFMAYNPDTEMFDSNIRLKETGLDFTAMSTGTSFSGKFQCDGTNYTGITITNNVIAYTDGTNSVDVINKSGNTGTWINYSPYATLVGYNDDSSDVYQKFINPNIANKTIFGASLVTWFLGGTETHYWTTTRISVTNALTVNITPTCEHSGIDTITPIDPTE